MNTDKELMQQALYALEQVAEYFSADSTEAKTITAIRECLAQPEQSYPDNFIDALKYDVARRDSEAQQAYEDAFVNGTGVMLGDKRIDATSIYKESEQEPVAWMHPDGRIWTFGRGFDKSTFTIPLYTTPPQRKPLTDEQIKVGWRTLPIQAPMSWSAYLAGARMAEAAHGIGEKPDAA